MEETRRIRSTALERRVAVAESLRAGRSIDEIISFFKHPRSTVYDIANSHNGACTMSREASESTLRKFCDRQRLVRTPNIVKRAKKLLSDDSGTSLRKHTDDILSVAGVPSKLAFGSPSVESGSSHCKYQQQVQPSTAHAASQESQLLTVTSGGDGAGDGPWPRQHPTPTPSASVGVAASACAVVTPHRHLTLDSLVALVERSSYLYDSANPLFASKRAKTARWHEIGAYFGISGEAAFKHWLGSVSRYKYVLRKLLVAKIRNETQSYVPGPWFDKVGSMIGMTMNEALAQLNPTSGVEDCLHHILLPLRNVFLEEGSAGLKGFDGYDAEDDDESSEEIRGGNKPLHIDEHF